uniref:Uncharacterized protein n=1 Tax=Meloidogyne hapla TaxID=6305 RepID=A0A1I8BIY3_MELHA
MDIYSLPQTEEAAIEFLQAKNILPTNKICTNCHEMKLSIGKQVRWRCCKSTCRSEINIRSGNWLEGSRIPIVTIVRFIYAWAFEMTSGEFCEREMKICPNTTIALTRLPTQLNYIFTGVLYIDSFNLLVYGHEIAVMLLVSIAIGIYIGSELNNSSIRNGVITFRGSYYGLYHIIDVSLRLIIWIICFAIFVLILRYNQRCYAFSRLPNKHTLVQRYQFAENVRSSKLLLAIGIIIFVCNLHFDFVMLRIAYNKDYFNVEYSQSFDFVLALALNAIPIAAISFHSSMLEAFKSHLKQLTNLCTLKKTNNSISDEPQNNINNSINHLPINSILPFPPNESTKIVGRLKNYKSPRALLTGQN